MNTKTCDECGAKMVEYKHHLNEPLVIALRRLVEAGGGPINLKMLGLTRNQWDNFQKLRYFDLVEQYCLEGQRKRGIWRVTHVGLTFVTHKVAIPPTAVTYRGERVRYEGVPIFISEVTGLYRPAADWAFEAVKH